VIEVMPGLPEGVLGVKAHGKLESGDYADVLRPAIEGALAASGQLRVVLVFEDWDGITAGAVWQDIKLGVEDFTKWKRLALVTDVDWVRHATNLFGWTIPGQVRTFSGTEIDAAIAWAAATD
jgi:hypothetical protein